MSATGRMRRSPVRGCAAQQNRPTNSPPSSGGTTKAAMRMASGRPSQGSATRMAMASGRSASREVCISSPSGGLSRRCTVSCQPWPSSQSTTCAMRVKSSGPCSKPPMPPSSPQPFQSNPPKANAPKRAQIRTSRTPLVPVGARAQDSCALRNALTGCPTRSTGASSRARNSAYPPTVAMFSPSLRKAGPPTISRMPGRMPAIEGTTSRVGRRAIFS